MKIRIPDEERSRVKSNLFVIFVTLLMLAVLYYIKDLWSVFTTVLTACTPFLIGILLAFVQMPVVSTLERFFIRVIPLKKPPKKLYRTLGAVVSLLLIIALVVVFMLILLPQMVKSIESIFVSARGFVENNIDTVSSLLVDHGLAEFDGTQLVMAWENIIAEASNYFSVFFQSAITISSSIYRIVFKVFIGMIAAVYILIDKEHFCAIGKKATYAYFDKEWAEKLIYWTREGSRIFSGFIAGKVLDSLIIGVICYISMMILGFNYPLLISVIIGVTNILPCFGPFIGAVPSVLILLVSSDPMQAVWFVLLIIVLQQLDGNLIGPLILGDQIGISAFWIMASILVGGALFGFMGMLLGVPVAALIYAIVKTSVENRLSRKGMEPSTEAYVSESTVKRRIFRRIKK